MDLLAKTKLASSAGLSAARSLSASRSLSATRLFLKKQIWIWPVVAAVLLALTGWLLRGRVEQSLHDTMAGNLQSILDADVAALEIWLESQRDNVLSAIGDERVRRHAAALCIAGGDDQTPTAALLTSTDLAELRDEMRPRIESRGYSDFVVTAPNRRVVGSLRDDVIGIQARSAQLDFIDRVLAGETLVSRPFKSIVTLKTADGEEQAGIPTMFAATPVRDDAGKIVGLVGLRIPPEDDFTRVLAVARPGKTGETYAFGPDGTLLSMSRFDDDLKRIGLLADQKDVASILNLEIRDPGVDMTGAERPALRRSEQPLTKMAAAAVTGTSGVDVDGYRDYRGVPVIGAWRWLKNYDFGVATELDRAEAYRPLNIFRAAFWGLFAMLAAASLAIFVFSLLVARLNRQAMKATLEARRLGQYHLEHKLGEGGMGVVYRGRHAMLQRPTAIKLLDPERTSPAAIARFEREVQLTSQLNHPNTIAVYDYGRTPEGVFYYAMEFLDGINLEELVRRDGPQREGRVIHILRQVCESLHEAHSLGLVHRDIKPANIMLNRRGGAADVVKVLDFGLVKSVDAAGDAGLTMAGTLTGTPLYLPPEAIQSPGAADARGDLYAVASVGYFLLTGTPVFTGESIVEICMRQVNKAPEPPSARIGRAVDADLEAVILACLAKKPDDRPQSADELLEALSKCRSAGTWTRGDAESWWARFTVGASAEPSRSPTASAIFAETMAQPADSTGDK